MKKFFIMLKNNLIFRRILYCTIVAFLFLYTFSIPAFSGRGKWSILLYLFMAALIGSVGLYFILYDATLKINKWFIIPTSFVVIAFIGTAIYSHWLVGRDGKAGWLTLLLMLITMIVFYYSYVAINNKKLVMMVLVFAFLLFAFYFAYVYRDKIIHLNLSSDRISVYFDNQNTVGFYFAIAYAIAMYLGLFFTKKIELLFLIPALLFLFLGLFTGSRAFLISVAIATISAMYLKLRKHKIIFLAGLVSLMGLFFLFLNIPQLAFLKDQFDRTIYTLFGVGNSKVDTSTLQRSVWPGYAFYLGGRNLLIGYGVNGFMIYSGVGTYAHNNFAEIICDFGIVGFMLFNLSIIIPFVLSFGTKESESRLVFVLALVLFSRCFFGVIYYAKETYLLLSLMFYLTKDCSLPRLTKFKLAPAGSYCEVSI